jgi:hypothetical protein
MPELPPELSTLGDKLFVAADRELRRRRLWRMLVRRTMRLGGVGAVLFAAMTPSELGHAVRADLPATGGPWVTGPPQPGVGASPRPSRAASSRLRPVPKGPRSFQRDSGFGGQRSQTRTPMGASRRPLASPTFSP